MSNQRVTSACHSLSNDGAFGVKVLFFAGAVAILMEAAFGQAPPETKNHRWISFSQAIQKAEAGWHERGGGVEVAVSSAEELTASAAIAGMDLDEKTMPDGKTYTAVRAPGAGIMEIGKPDLPAFGNWILIPNGTQLVLEVEPGNPVVYTDIDVPPVQPPLADVKGAKIPPFTKDVPTYKANTDYPGVFARPEPTESMRGQDCTVLWVYPFQYNPKQRVLTVYPDLTVSVRFVGKVKGVPLRLKSKPFEAMMHRLAANAKVVLEAEEQAVEKEENATEIMTTQTGCDYLIICHADFQNAADTLAAWKQKSGYRTMVVTTATAGTTYTAIDTYIENGYNTWDIVPAYLLFIGDTEFVPTCPGFYHPSCVDQKGKQGIIGSDLRYSTVGVFDATPEIIVGRLPVDTATQANNLVNRIIDYEKNPTATASYYTNVTLAAAFQDGEGDIAPDGYETRRFAKTAEDIHSYLTGQGYTAERIYTTYNGHNNDTITPTNWSDAYIFENDGAGGAALPAELCKPTFAWDGDAADITAAVNAGTFFLCHRDHGSRDGWGEPAFDNGDVDALNNGSLRPVVWSINCQTGWFDNETDQDQCNTANDSESFAEHWLRHGTGGAVGVLAATRVSYSGYNDRLTWGWMDAIWPDFIDSYLGGGRTYPSTANNTAIYRMGDVLNYGKVYLRTKYNCVIDWQNICFTEIQLFHWFGDPTMEIWTAQPGTLSVTKPGYSSAHKYLDVQVKDSSANALSGARVTFYAKDKGWYSGTTDASGNIRFNFPEAVTATFDLTVTLHNFKPYTETVSVAYSDTTYPSVPTYNNGEGQYLKSNPLLNIDFSDDSNLDAVYYKVDAGGAWNLITSGINGKTYTTNWSMSTTVWNGISQGIHYLYFKVVDDAGNETITANDTAAFQFGKDDVVPTKVSNLASSSHSANGYSTDTTIDVSWTAATDSSSSVHGYSYEWSNSSSTVPDTIEDILSDVTSRTSGVLAEGAWYFHIRACDSTVDLDGALNPNWGLTEHAGPYYVDITKPQAPVYYSSLGQWNSAVPTLDIDFGDDRELKAASWKKKGDTTWQSIFSSFDGLTYTTNWSMGSSGWSALPEGTSYIYFKIEDDAGNVYETPNDAAAFTIVKDVTSPTIAYNSSEGEYYTSAAPTLDIDFDDDMGGSDGKLALIKYKIDSGGSWITLASNVDAAQYTTNWQIDSTTWSNLADGTHYIYFDVSDKAGNFTQTQNDTQAFDIKKDTIPPAAKNIFTNTGIILEGDTVHFDGTGSSDASGISKYEWDFDNSNGIQVDATGATVDHVYNTRGVYTVTLTVYDPADNTGTDTVAVTIKCKPDATIDLVSPGTAIGGQKVNFSGSGNDRDGDGIVAYNWRSDIDGPLSTNSGFSTDKLTPSDFVPHTIYFKVKDSDGFWSDEAQYTLWVYWPKKWDMFKENDPRHSSQSTYPGIPHGQMNFATRWSYLTNGAIAGSAAAANLDNNLQNGLEVAFTSTDPNLYVVDNAGKLLWSKNIGTSSSTPAIEDINNDGYLEIVVGSANGVYAYDPNGTNVYTFVPGTGGTFDSSPAIAEIDATSVGKETVIGCSDGNVYAISSTGVQLWAFPSPTLQAFTSSPTIAEIEGTKAGQETIIGGTDGTLYIIDSTGAQITSFTPPAPVQPITTTPAVADLVPVGMGWPGPEIVFGSVDGYLYCLNYNSAAQSLAVAWQYPLAVNLPLMRIDSSPAIGKVGEYGENHIVFGCDDGNVYVLRADTGVSIGQFSCGAGIQVNSTPAIANIDTVNFIGGSQGDLPEVIFGATNGNLYAVSFAMGFVGQNLPWSPLALSAGQAIDSSPAVADLNHSADLEILIGSANSRLYMIRAWAGFNLNPVAVTRISHLGLYGQGLSLDGSGSYDPDEEETGDYITRYVWDINPPGYPSYETSQAVTTIPWTELEQRGIYAAGNYPAQLTVYDSYNEPSSPVSTTIAIRYSVPSPTAVTDGPYEVFVGTGVTLSGSGSYAQGQGNELAKYEWDLDYDGSFDDGSGEEIALSWQDLETLGISEPGSQYTIKLRVTDLLDQQSTPAETTITILENQLPTANANGPYEIAQESNVVLTASGNDPDGYITAYQWDINNDGLFGEYTGDTVDVPWSYLQTACSGRGEDNPNPIRVRAYDNYNAYSTSQPAYLYIYVNQPVAMAKANGSTEPISVLISQDVTFDHSASYHEWPSQHAIVLYEWDCDGNGTYEWSTTNPAQEHNYAYVTGGIYNVKLRVTDNNAPARTAIDTIQITVANYPPIANPAGPYSAAWTDGVTLNGSGSFDPDGTIVKYEWDLNNDGIFGDRVGVSCSLSWTDLTYFGLTHTGTSYPVSLRVTDNQGAVGSASTTLNITKEEVAVADPSVSAVYSDEITVTVTVTDNDGQNLANQLALAKTFYLEVYNGSSWQLLSQDILNSSGDIDRTLNFSVRIQQGLVDLVSGVYPLRVRFDGDHDYNSKIQTGTLNLLKEEPSISQPQAIVVYGNSIAVSVTARDNDSQTLFNQFSAPKTIYLQAYNGTEWLPAEQDTLSSIDNSDYTLDYIVSVGPGGVDLPSGVHTLRAKFDGDAYYESAIGQGTLTVMAKAVQSIDDIDLPADDWNWTVTYSDLSTISCRLVDANGLNLLHQADEPKNVFLDVNDGSQWLTVATDSLSSVGNSDNTLQIGCEIQEGLGDVTPGVHPLRVRFDGDSRYGSCIHEGTLTIEKEHTQFTDPSGDWQWTFTDGDEMTISIKLLDDNSERLYHVSDEPKIVYADYYTAGNWVNFASGQITQAGETDASSYENVLMEFTWEHGTGTFDIRFRFEGDTYYDSVISQTAALVIAPAPVVLHVPSEYLTIQQAIDAAGNGDIVLVADDTYSGLGNKDLTWDANSKHITVMSEDGPDGCIIDCQNSGRGFNFTYTHQNNTDVIKGFTIKGGNADYGGGIYCIGSSPTISNCIITENTASYGGGVADANSTSVMVNCVISGNSASGTGGGIYCADDSNLAITNCTITGNQVKEGAGDQAAYWKFDEGSGTIAHDYADGNHGTIYGATWTAGKIGTALYFHGGGQWDAGSNSVTVPNSPSINLTGPFTIAAWIKATGSDNYMVITDKLLGSPTISNGFSFYISGGSLRLTIYSGSSGNRDVFGISQLRDDAWHHVAAMWDGSYAKIYVDGEPEGQGPWLYPPASTDNPIGIGKRLGGWGGYLPFLGTIDEVAIYHRALSPQEIQTLSEGGGGGGGGGAYCSDSSIVITNCTISGNSAGGSGDGLFYSNSNAAVTNCILWSNLPQEIYVGSGNPPVVTYSDVQGGWSDDGNINADPRFVEPGYWDPNGTPGDTGDDFWVDGNYHIMPISPCIDAGSNDAVGADTADLDDDGNTTEQLPWDFDNQPRFVDDPDIDDTGIGSPPVVDMGVDEFPYLGDLNFSGSVNLIDFAAFAAYWVEGNCGNCGGADFTGDGYVDSGDLEILAENWLAGTE